MKKIIYIILAIFFLILSFFIILDEIYYEEVEMNFINKNSELRGKLILPKTKKQSYPLLIFVHGDGAMPYDAYGYYNPGMLLRKMELLLILGIKRVLKTQEVIGKNKAWMIERKKLFQLYPC